MRGGRGKLPVLAAISAAAVEGSERIWSLHREDLEQLSAFPRWFGARRTLLVSGVGDRGAALAVALAATAAGEGRRTALLECDLLAPRLAVQLGLRPAPGLHEYLRWEATPAELLQPLTLTGPAAAAAEHPLVCIVAGRAAADPTVLLGLQSFRHMMMKLAHAYDLVLIAGPPLEEGPDGLAAFAGRADGLIAAISPRQRSGRAHRSLRGMLRRLPVETVGAVVVGGEEAQRS